MRMDGFAVLKRWRQNGRTPPVLALRARGSWEELLAWLRSVIRRSAGRPTSMARVGALEAPAGRLRRKFGARWYETRRGFGDMPPDSAP